MATSTYPCKVKYDRPLSRMECKTLITSPSGKTIWLYTYGERMRDLFKWNPSLYNKLSVNAAGVMHPVEVKLTIEEMKEILELSLLPDDM